MPKARYSYIRECNLELWFSLQVGQANPDLQTGHAVPLDWPNAWDSCIARFRGPHRQLATRAYRVFVPSCSRPDSEDLEWRRYLRRI